jgi:hypothetical protein
MKSQKETNETLDLEHDLLLTREDMSYMNNERIGKDPDLGSYFDFLEAMGAFVGPAPRKVFYDAQFEL